jgi:transglutaminase-like putative cysteine protease
MHPRTRLTNADFSRLAIGGAIAVGIMAAAGLAMAQRAPRTLHQELPLSDRKPTPLIGSAGGSGNPAAFQSGNKILVEPSADARKSGEPVLGQGGFAADRQTSMTPDGNTGADGTLHYVSVFNPDVLPFKRMSSFDAVAAASYKLFVGRSTQVTVPVSGTADTDKTRDRFWGSLMIELGPGKDIPLPSVAPDMRILSYETKPPVRLEFAKDGADNFFVRAANPSTSGSFRLIFLADADAGYFAPSLPTTSRRLTPGIVEQAAPSAIRQSLPADVRAQAELTLRKLKLNRDQDLGEVFNGLVAYFRAFEAKPLAGSSGNIYRDLCDTKAGVCRHRSFAFMITANAVGIPTRYVQNEAHAFVEVWFPERGWQRIDLGGAALRMEVQNANDKTLHRPRAEDPFAKPPQYKNNYTQLEGQIGGLSQQQIQDKRASLDDQPASGQFDTQAAGSGSGTAPDQTAPDPRLPVAPNDPKKATPVLEVLEADASGYRGAAIRISGRAHVNGKAIPDHPIDVFLAPKGDGRDHRHIGRAVTGADGTFRQEFSVPGDLGLATYEIWLGSPGDAYYNNALSQ